MKILDIIREPWDRLIWGPKMCMTFEWMPIFGLNRDTTQHKVIVRRDLVELKRQQLALLGGIVTNVERAKKEHSS